MICYQSNLALRDSNKDTFELRVRESMLFVEKNHPGYRMYMLTLMGIDRKNCTYNTVPALKDMAPMFVTGHAQWGVMTASILLLNSRCGCILAAIHSLCLAVGANLIYLRPFLL